MRIRFHGWLVALVACAPVDPPLAEETGGATRSSEETVSTTSSSDQTSAVTSSAAESPGGVSMPVAGEWVGMYDAGFGWAYFTPCGSDKEWFVVDTLPGYEYCEQGPLWLHLTGTVSDDPEYPGEKIVTVESFEGPCLAGTCEDGPTDYCDTFDAFCLEETGECNPIFQDCPVGEKCAPGSAGAVCVPVDPDPAGLGESCLRDPRDFEDTCDADALCQISDPDIGEGECVPLCTGKFSEPICEDPDRACLLGGSYAYCLSRCDPLPGDCPEMHTCIYGAGALYNTFVCILGTHGGKKINEPCDSLRDCADGLLCVDPTMVPCPDKNVPGCCAALCRQDDPPCEAPGTECVPWSYDPPPGHEDLGVCMFPP